MFIDAKAGPGLQVMSYKHQVTGCRLQIISCRLSEAEQVAGSQ